MQPQTRRQLLGILEVELQGVREPRTLDGHDALVALRALIGLERDRQVAGTDERADVLGRRLALQLAMARQPPHAETRGALGEQQMHRSIALQLQRQHAVEFDRRREQKRGRHRFAQ